MRTGVSGMSWNKDYSGKPLSLKGPHLGKLMRRVRDLESRGYEHVRPYETHKKIWKDYAFDMYTNFGKGKYKLNGYEIETEYSFLMRKKAE